MTSRRMEVVSAAEQYVAALEEEEESIRTWEESQMDDDIPMVKRLCAEARMHSAKAQVPAKRAQLVLAVDAMHNEQEN